MIEDRNPNNTTTRERTCYHCKQTKNVSGENMRDMVERKRYCKKLSDDDVRSMKRMRSQGVYYRRIANAFSVDYATAYRAINGMSWKHIS